VSTPVLVGTARDQLEADVICSFLRAEGIPSWTSSWYGGPFGSSWADDTDAFEIYVDESDAERARELLAAKRDERGRI
jgi:hypothetical protein